MSNSAKRPRWWGYVKNVICAYPQLHRELLELQRGAQSSGEFASGSGRSVEARPTEGAALKTLSHQSQREHDAVEAALREAACARDGERIVALITTVYFRKSKTISGAAMELHLSTRTAVRRAGQFIWLVADKLGLTG